jgi:hypothetical protein
MTKPITKPPFLASFVSLASSTAMSAVTQVVTYSPPGMTDAAIEEEPVADLEKKGGRTINEWWSLFTTLCELEAKADPALHPSLPDAVKRDDLFEVLKLHLRTATASSQNSN